MSVVRLVITVCRGKVVKVVIDIFYGTFYGKFIHSMERKFIHSMERYMEHSIEQCYVSSSSSL